jgi:hypothetical protein
MFRVSLTIRFKRYLVMLSYEYIVQRVSINQLNTSSQRSLSSTAEQTIPYNDSMGQNAKTVYLSRRFIPRVCNKMDSDGPSSVQVDLQVSDPLAILLFSPPSMISEPTPPLTPTFRPAFSFSLAALSPKRSGSSFRLGALGRCMPLALPPTQGILYVTSRQVYSAMSKMMRASHGQIVTRPRKN